MYTAITQIQYLSTLTHFSFGERGGYLQSPVPPSFIIENLTFGTTLDQRDEAGLFLTLVALSLIEKEEHVRFNFPSNTSKDPVCCKIAEMCNAKDTQKILHQRKRR